MDGIDALPDENTHARQDRNGARRPGLRHETVMRILGVGGLMEAIRA